MKTTYIISTLFLSVLIWACDLMGDVDKVKPYYKLEDQTAIRNAQSAEQVLRGVYTQWRAMSLCNFRSHIGLLAGSLALSGSGGLAGETGFTDNNVLEDNSIIGNVYNNLYDVINAANFMIEFLENNSNLFRIGWALCLPLVSIVLNVLAIRAIGRDEVMVKAADRLR